MAVGDFNLGSNIDLNGNKIKGGGWEVLSAAPSANVTAYQIYVNSFDGFTYQRNAANTAWVNISSTTNDIILVVDAIDTTTGRTPAQLISNVVVDGNNQITGKRVLITDNANKGVWVIQSSGPALSFGTPNFVITQNGANNSGKTFTLNSSGLGYLETSYNWSYMPIKTTLTDSELIPIFDGAAGNTNKRATFTALKAYILTIPLLGWVVGSNADVTASDTITGAIGKLQALINNYAARAVTFTNKTIDAATNTLSNISTTMFAANVIDNDATMAANSATRIATQQATKTYVDNKVAGQSWKQAVRVATVANGTLATAFANGQVVDGVTLATNDRIALKNQSTASENGIYTVNASGAPTRATDADTGLELFQAAFFVSEGTTQSDTQWVVSNNGTITVGSTGLTFSQIGNGSVPSASTSVEGKVYLATLAEAEAKADTLKAVVSADLANFLLSKSTPFAIGNGSATSFALTHNFGKKIKGFKMRKVSDGSSWGDCGYDTSNNVYTVNFGAYVPTTNEFEVELTT